MSILAEVLSSVNTVEIQKINEKVPELKIKIEDVETQIVEYMENLYLNFGARPRENKKVFTEVQAMEEEIISLKSSIENIRKKQLSELLTSIEKHIINLETISLKLSIVSRVCEINEQLVRYDALLESSEYFSCMKLIYDLEMLYCQIPENEQLQFLSNIILTIESKKNILLDKLAIVFSEHIKVDYMNGNHVILKIKKDSAHLKKAFRALYFDDSVISCLSSFSSSLWQYFITPAVDNTVEITEKEDNDFTILEIIINSSKNKPLYPKVFSNLQVIFKFLKANFDFELAEHVSVMKLIGDDLRDNLYELIIKHCLEDTIPTTTEDLQNYKTVIQETEKFEKTLQTFDIFSEDSTTLKEYVSNVDIHYINKKCKQYLLQSDIIMKKDLHDMKEVGTPYNSDNLLDFPESELPHCCVSKSAIELIDFLEGIMKQAASASEGCAGQLLDTIKTIIIKYGHFVPHYHSKLLQTIPQQVAIFQNNCLFINYELTKWTEKYYLKFPQQLVTGHYNTVEAAGQVKQIGVDCFKTYVSKTKESLVIVGIQGPTLEDLSPETEKSIRQCMRQQELLKTVWQKVLSYSLYNKTMGALLDTMCINLINAVVCLEDISSKAAEQLVEVFKIVITRGPKLFTDPKEINLFVQSWYKFNELNFVLAASLVDINDRWADGKGPLALQFKANELKSLIRALFQNTDRRAAVLARIL